MLAQDRRERLLAEMRNAGVEALVVMGTSWQEAYLRYVADFATLEGSAIAILTADGRCRVLFDSVIEAERASGETRDVEIKYVRDVGRAVADELDRISNQKLAATPRALLPPFLTSGERKFRLDDGAEPAADGENAVGNRGDPPCHYIGGRWLRLFPRYGGEGRPPAI